MRIVVGDDTGLLKSISIEEKRLLSTFGEQKESNGVQFINVVNEEEVLLKKKEK